MWKPPHAQREGAPVISHLVTVMVLASLTMAAAALYLLPALIGWARHMPGLAAIAVIDITLGWTFVGWVIALVLALRPAYPAGPIVQLVQHLPPPSGPPSQPPNAGWAGPPGPGRRQNLLPPPGPAGSAGWAGPAGEPAPRTDSPPPLVLPS